MRIMLTLSFIALAALTCLPAHAQYQDIRINELMASNDTTIQDEFGEYDDWLEITNIGTSAVSLLGLGLTDDLVTPDAYLFPDITLGAGEYLLVWCDDDVMQGDMHAAFKLSSDGEGVFLMDTTTVPDPTIVDATTFPSMGADVTWGRYPDGTGAFKLLGAATPGAENDDPQNPDDYVLYINEFMADNDNVHQDEAGDYDDWVEIYNPNEEAVHLEGYFLTDDLSNTTKWMFPEVDIPAGGFLLIWCDDEPEQGDLHATIKLSKDGEDVGLYQPVSSGNDLVDSYIFDSQTTDVSEGRQTDGGVPWVFFTSPTPEASNEAVAGTVTAEMSCLPSSGTLPFATQMSVTLSNNYTGITRRMAARINVAPGNGSAISNWRAGFTNVPAGDSFSTTWGQNLPALATLIGDNIFTLVAEDVTPAPYNQPPYPASGDTDSGSCTVTATAP